MVSSMDRPLEEFIKSLPEEVRDEVSRVLLGMEPVSRAAKIKDIEITLGMMRVEMSKH